MFLSLQTWKVKNLPDEWNLARVFITLTAQRNYMRENFKVHDIRRILFTKTKNVRKYQQKHTKHGQAIHKFCLTIKSQTKRIARTEIEVSAKNAWTNKNCCTYCCKVVVINSNNVTNKLCTSHNIQAAPWTVWYQVMW